MFIALHASSSVFQDVSYSITLDLDVLMVVAQPDKGSASHTTVYRLVNVDSLADEERRRFDERGGPPRHPIMLPRSSHEIISSGESVAGRSRRR